MRVRLLCYCPLILTGLICCWAAGGSSQETPREAKSPPAADEKKPVSVGEARERAKLLHEVYETTLQTIHLRYFRDDAGMTIPSRALEDVFARVGRRSDVKARWISVNARAMSLDHEPEDDFEKQAARSLAGGKPDHELVENGIYRRATPIRLSSSCIKCHAPPPMNPNVDRMAGLVISLPVSAE